MIRQAISCDICGTDKQQTNHWFVAYDQAGELRIGGWNSLSRLRAGAKHLCGQTCLHKLVDEFMAKTIAKRTPAAEKTSTASQAKSKLVRPKSAAPPSRIDASLTSAVSYAAQPRPVPRPVPVPEPVSAQVEVAADGFEDEYESSARLITPAAAAIAEAVPVAPAYNSTTWRAEAWKREREREQRTARRRSIAS